MPNDPHSARFFCLKFSQNANSVDVRTLFLGKNPVSLTLSTHFVDNSLTLQNLNGFSRTKLTQTVDFTGMNRTKRISQNTDKCCHPSITEKRPDNVMKKYLFFIHSDSIGTDSGLSLGRLPAHFSAADEHIFAGV